jgi:hypothetical protein
MTIEIHRPELEALIRQRMKSGGFQNVEDALMQALKSSSLPAEQDAGAPDERLAAMGADLVAAMQASPYKEVNLEPTRDRMRVRDVVF